MSVIMNKFSDWLLEQLNEKKWSQADLARASGLTRATISYYLGPKSKKPDESAVRKIAKAFNLPIDLVYEKAGILPPKPELSPIKRVLLHLAEGLPDSDLEMVISLLEQRTEYYKKNPSAKPTK